MTDKAPIQINKQKLIELGKLFRDELNNAKKIQARLVRQRDRETVLEYYGHKCACCGENKKEFLQVDHIDNDGAKHRKVIGKSSIYSWLRKNQFPEGFQLLCANCNCAKGFYGYCPHWGAKDQNHE